MDVSGTKFARVSGKKLALVSALIPNEHKDYCKGGTVSLGSEKFQLPVCKSKQDFIDNINKSNIVHVKDQGTWQVAPSQGAYGFSGRPENVFESEHGIRKKVMKVGANHHLLDVVQYQIEAPHVHIKPAHTTGVHEYKVLSNSNSYGSIDQSPCLLGTEMQISNPGLVANAKVPITLDRVWSRGQHESTDVLLQGEDFVSTQTVNSGRFVIPLWNQNEGLLVNSQCLFQIRHRHKVLFQFRTRIEFKDILFATVNAQLALECKEISVELNNNKVEVWGTTNGVRAKCLQGLLDIPADSRLCIVPVAECEIPELYHQEVAAPAGDAVSLCLAVKTPNDADWYILNSGTTVLQVISSVLHVNNVNTGIAIGGNIDYVISASYTGTRIEAHCLTLSNSALQTYVSGGNEPTFQQTNVFAYTTLGNLASANVGIGEFIWVFGNSDKIEKQILASVLGSTWNARDVNLGTYDEDGTFSGGATLVDNVLTHLAVPYTRIVPTIDSEISKILGVAKEVINAEVGRKVFQSRIKAVHIHAIGPSVKGLDGASLIWSGKADNNEIHCENLQYHKFVHSGPVKVVSSFIDAADLTENFHSGDCKFVLSVK